MNNNPDLTIKCFSIAETKSYTLTINWTDGDTLCIFSLDENDQILYRDTCTVSSPGNRKNGTINALVHKEAVKYYACYPYDAITSMSELDRDTFHVRTSGKFADSSIMTAEALVTDNTLSFEERFSLLKIYGQSKSMFPINVVIKDKSYTFNNYLEEIYVPMFSENTTLDKFDISYKSGKRTTTLTKYPKVVICTGVIYPIKITK